MTAPVGVGVIGAGRPNIATSNQLPAMRNLDSVRIVALCDQIAEGVRKYAAEYGATPYTSYAEMLARSDIEMVQVATPDWLHARHAIQALEAGKHVLVQKPMCIDQSELADMVRAARHNGRLLQCLLAGRWTDPVRKVRDIVQSGKIGELVHMEIRQIGRRFPIHDSSSPYLQAALGGVWFHNGMHLVDEIVSVAGSVPERIFMATTRNGHGTPEFLGETDNYYLAYIDLSAGPTCTIEYNTALLQDGLPAGVERVYIGTGGEIRQRYGAQELEITRVGTAEVEVVPAGYDHADSIRAFSIAIGNFAHAIRQGAETAPTLDESVQVLQTLFGGLASAQSGEPVALPVERISI